jgi:tetratricopeptide (TPR) repeat protein
MFLGQAHYEQALEAGTKMRMTAEAMGDELIQAHAWNQLSTIHDRAGNYRAALECAEKAEALAHPLAASEPDNRKQVELALALLRKGWAFYRLGYMSKAPNLAEQALRLSAQTNARREMADSLNLLGVIYMTVGRYEQAIQSIQEALALHRELGNRRQECTMLNNLGETARLRGDYRAAVEFYQQALVIAQEIGDRDTEEILLNNLGGARVGLGEYAAAQVDLRRVIGMSQATGLLAETHRFLAEACLRQGQVEAAFVAAQHALALAQQVERPEFIAGAWHALGLIASQAAIQPDAPNLQAKIKDQKLDAAACFAESARFFEQIRAEGERARVLRAWARYEIDRGDSDRGQAMWEEAKKTFARLGMAAEVERMAETP